MYVHCTLKKNVLHFCTVHVQCENKRRKETWKYISQQLTSWYRHSYNCFAGIGNYIAVFVRNKAFPRCGKTFFVNNSCEFD